ncbi:hypothetical protein [Bdellovibrio sp. HCB-162]|uniref:hypothetical protein n=1 Tax=Bdellovibrio sp. HCB-162 TaxID=3394234 RepID=UPI0039BD0441
MILNPRDEFDLKEVDAWRSTTKTAIRSSFIMKRILAVVILGVSLASYLWDVKQDRSKTIKILKTTPLYGEWEPINGNAIGNVEPGETLKVLRIRYAKDHMAVKVERSNGSTGWLILDSSVEISQQ